MITNFVHAFAVFHVKDEHGNKVTDRNVLNYIQQVINLVNWFVLVCSWIIFRIINAICIILIEYIVEYLLISESGP